MKRKHGCAASVRHNASPMKSGHGKIIPLHRPSIWERLAFWRAR